MLKVLVVDDEPDLCALIADALVEEGYEVTCAKDGAEAMAAASAATFDVVLADMRLPKVDGLTLLRWLRDKSPSTDLIVMTGNAAVADAVTVLKEGAFDYLTKPVHLEELSVQLRRLGEFRLLQRDVAAMRAELTDEPSSRDRMVGHSPGMLELIKRMDTIAHSDAPVLITGESGTGKELVARALHERVGARERAVRRGQLRRDPRDAARERAVRPRARRVHRRRPAPQAGRFEEADGGTLFLDEIGELPLAAAGQAAARAAGGEFEPRRRRRPVKVDVRIIAATHRDLRARSRRGPFREDLYYRLNVVELAIPPLRARGGDLAVLVHHFIQRFSVGERPVGITWRAWNALAGHPFPGNVRELMHTIQHAVLLSAGGKIDLEHLPTDIRGKGIRAGLPNTETMAPLGVALKQFEREFLVRALAEFEGKKGKAADQLASPERTSGRS